MNVIVKTEWDGVERRKPGSCRRKSDRRSYRERRCDPRQTPNTNRNFYGWLRSITHKRLGVDRRKNSDQRILMNRRSSSPSAMLTKEELADLLS